MFAAARKGDPLTHDLLVPSGVIGPPLTGPCPAGLVIIEGLPAAHVTCSAVCVGTVIAGIVHPPPPGPPPPIIVGALNVHIHSKPAARWAPSGDLAGCGSFIGDMKLLATRTVFIGGAPSMSPPVAALSMMAHSVNPQGGSINCGKIIDAAIDRIDGTNPSAVAPTGQNGSFSAIEARHNTTINWNSSFQSAFNAVQAGGDGTTAIVGIQYSTGGAHVVTMTNKDGQVGIIEGQDWGPNNPPEAITTPARANARYNANGGSNVGFGIIPSGD
jgi:hypothetical protein